MTVMRGMEPQRIKVRSVRTGGIHFGFRRNQFGIVRLLCNGREIRYEEEMQVSVNCRRCAEIDVSAIQW